MGAILSYRDLDVWRLAMDLVERCYELSAAFPRSEEFGLRAQLRRSAVSIPSNVAEGHGRSATGDYCRHVFIAHGSLMELETQVQIAGRLGYLDAKALAELQVRTEELGRMLNALGRKLRERTAGRGAAVAP
jgi:four helix bundle protein